MAAAAFAASGRLGFMAGMVALAAGALAIRGWVVRRIDAQQDAWRAGDTRPAVQRFVSLAAESGPQRNPAG